MLIVKKEDDSITCITVWLYVDSDENCGHTQKEYDLYVAVCSE